MKNIRFSLQLLFLLILFGGCAKMGSMSGGYKDELPPKLLNSKPLNYSVNFNSQKIELIFDEYIALKNVNQELIISPPLPKKPDVRIKNKSILIDLKNELRENTTYTLNFGKALTDNNEGNPLTNFEFVFSTGSYLDSLSVKGALLSAFNLQPSKEPFIAGLYDLMEDSVPLKSIPVYVGKTDEKGIFQINNIKADTFRIFALKDLNFNLIYDLPTEEIAFIDTVLYITPEFLSTLPVRLAEIDTTLADTAEIKVLPNAKKKSGKTKSKDLKEELPELTVQDSSVIDTLEKEPSLPALYVDMFSFIEEGKKQYITNKERLSKECFQLGFSLMLKDNPGAEFLDFEEPENWFLQEINARRDTFTFWIRDTTIINRDTLKLVISYPRLDSVGSEYTHHDTISFISRKPAEKAGKGKPEEKKPVVRMKITTIRNNGMLDFNSNLPLHFNFPLDTINFSQIQLFAKEDTTEKAQNFEILKDSLSSQKVFIVSKWKEKTRYRLQAYPGAFTDIYDQTTDTFRLTFNLQEKSYYGTLTLSLTNVSEPLHIELMNEKENVLRTKDVTSDGSFNFELLPPAKYKLKFIYDLNKNKKWDTGNYLKGIQPEKVLYYIGEINIRSNWELEVKQTLK